LEEVNRALASNATESIADQKVPTQDLDAAGCQYPPFQSDTKVDIKNENESETARPPSANRKRARNGLEFSSETCRDQ